MSETKNGIESEHAFEKASDEGCVVVTPKNDEIFIDIDSDHQYKLFKSRLERFNRNVTDPLEIVKDNPSKSGLPRRHVVVKSPFELSHWSRVALQAALGSDGVRELLSCCRIVMGDKIPTLFIEPSGALK